MRSSLAYVLNVFFWHRSILFRQDVVNNKLMEYYINNNNRYMISRVKLISAIRDLLVGVPGIMNTATAAIPI